VTPSLLAQLDFNDVLLIAAGVILGLAVINTIRWGLSRRRRVHLPEEFLVEMSRFAQRFQRSADQMSRLSKLMENPTRLAWKVRNAEILKTLRQMNRLLQRLNDFFEDRIQDYETHPTSDASAERSAGASAPGGDFEDHPDEETTFRQMKRITRSEIAHTDWDALLERLRESGENTDHTD